MKKVPFYGKCLCCLLVFLCMLTGCSDGNSTKQDNSLKVDTIYLDFLKGINSNDIYYAIQDIDGVGSKELMVLQNTKLSVYSYDDSVKEIGEFDFQTGTFRLLNTNQTEYPGIICFTTGGSAEHYQYLTIKDGRLSVSDLWKLDYSNNESKQEINLCDDLSLIDISKSAYKNNQDIEFILFE